MRMCCDGGCGSPHCAGQQDSAGAAAGQVSVSTHRQTQGHVFIARTHTHNMEHATIATITPYLKNRYYCYMYLLSPATLHRGYYH